MNATPIYTEAAKQDLEQILDFVKRDKPRAAARLVERIEAKCKLLAEIPETGRLVIGRHRKFRVSSAGRYMILHSMINDKLYILRVIPGGVDLPNLN